MMVRSLLPMTMLFGLVVVGCATTGRTASNDGVVTGSVAYRERMALPPDAVVRVSLTDVSRTDAAAMVVAETTVVAGGRQVPVPFALHYDRSRIDPTHSYAVRAVIRSGERMLFTTDAAPRVITQGNPTQVDMRLVRVATGDVATGSNRLEGTAWVLEDLAGNGVLTRAQATLEFADSGRVSGNGSCNRFSGGVELSGESITFGRLATTRMACLDDVGKQEATYLKALQDAERIRLGDTTLFIYSKGMAQPLRFRKTS
jgi:putative lipoprotein